MTLIMGIVNVTPDSFSDGGRWFDADAAIGHAVELVADGAHIIDIGGESTRPGAEPLTSDEELQRVLPVVTELAARGIRVSIDTMHAATATACVEAGAEFVNDVSGGLADPDMYSAVAVTPATYIAMHWRGLLGRTDSTPDDERARYEDVVDEVRAGLERRMTQAVAAGIPLERIVLDPGLGFSKQRAHNWQLLARMDELRSLGRPLLIGHSRKRFLGDLAGDRDVATSVVSALSAVSGAWAVRVHDVASTRAALEVADAWTSGREAHPGHGAALEPRLEADGEPASAGEQRERLT
ncbi:dihydropteroate synthase [Ruicaihuangia caeni]|uniref:dihydropteroate synthase n=1 Tax=Ruicaihuangia caeni TaxID=3042517 RepID=UPI00339068F7